MEKFLAKQRKEQKEEIETLKQTREARSFAWMACYAVCRKTKPARLETNQKTGKPMLDIDWTEMTLELMRNLPCTIDENRLNIGLTVRAPKMKMTPTPQKSESTTPFTVQIGFSNAKEHEYALNFQRYADAVATSFINAHFSANKESD